MSTQIQEKLITITENVPRVYDAGVAEGRSQEWSDFWDAFQSNGTKRSYENAFKDWPAACFDPKYDIIGSGTYAFDQTFFRFRYVDLKAILNKNNITIDSSQCGRLNQTFYGGSFGYEIPPLDLSNCTELFQTFGALNYDVPYVTRKITLNNLREDCVFSNPFRYSYYITEIVITGTIGQNGFDVYVFQSLRDTSITNIINCLSDTTSGLTIQFSKVAVDKAFATTTGGTDGSTSARWNNLVATKPNWTISLV